MSKRTRAAKGEKRVDWTRWLRDPQHWQRFYDQVATQTFAAVSKEIWDGKLPDEAADLAIEDVTAKMRAEGVPEDVVVSYREEYLKHRPQLIEIAGEIGDTMPVWASPEDGGAEAESLARLPMLLPLWFAKIFWGGAAHCFREMELWCQGTGPASERRHPEMAREDPALVGQAGRRRREVNVERL